MDAYDVSCVVFLLLHLRDLTDKDYGPTSRSPEGEQLRDSDQLGTKRHRGWWMSGLAFGGFSGFLAFGNFVEKTAGLLKSRAAGVK